MGNLLAGARPAVLALLALLIGFSGGELSGQSIDLAQTIPAELRGLSADQLFRRGMTLHAGKDFRGSSRLFYYATVVAPDQARDHFNLACALSQLGNEAAAVEELRRAVEVDPSWPVQKYLDDPDLDPIRTSIAWSEFQRSLAGGQTLPKGAWEGGWLAFQGKNSAWLEPLLLKTLYNQATIRIDADYRIQLTGGAAPTLLALRGEARMEGSSGALQGWTYDWASDPFYASPPRPFAGILGLRRLSPDMIYVELHDPGSPTSAPVYAEVLRRNRGYEPVEGIEPDPLAAADARLPEEASGRSASQLLQDATSAAARGDTDGAGRLAWWSSLLAPSRRAHLMVAREMARRGAGGAALYELGQALESMPPAERDWLARELESSDFDKLRRESAWTELLIRCPAAGGLSARWCATDVDPGSLPPWMTASELAPPAYLLSLGLEDDLRLTVMAGYDMPGTWERRGTSVYWRGREITSTGDGTLVSGAAMGGILQIHLLAPDWLELKPLVGDGGPAPGVYRRVPEGSVP